MVNKRLSGFLTALPQAQAGRYADSGFRIIKERDRTAATGVPMIAQPAGDYLITKAANTGEGIERGLAAIRQWATQHGLTLGDDLWQFNLGVDVTRLGLTENSILAYQIK